MANRLYLISSLFFLAGATVAVRTEQSHVNWLYLIGSVFFFFAAAIGVLGRKRP